MSVQAFSARVFTSGGEKTAGSYAQAGANNPEMFTLVAYGGHSQSGIVRSGNGSLTYTFNGTPTLAGDVIQGLSMTSPVWYRSWIKLTGTHNVNSTILHISSGSSTIELYWLLNDKMVLRVNGVNKDTTAFALNTSTGFAIVKIYSSWDGSSDTTRMILGNETTGLDTLWDVSSTMSGTPIQIYFGLQVLQLNPGGSVIFDDIAFNDASGVYENGAPDDSGRVYALFPVADDSLGNWVNGIGGTTNLYPAIDNHPAIGLDTTNENQSSQIKHDNSSASDYTCFIQKINDYLDAALRPIPSDKAIRVFYVFIRHGEHRALGVKTGRVVLVSNPSGTATSFTFGNDLGSHKKDVVNISDPAYDGTLEWFTIRDSYQYFPTVDRSTTTKVRISYVSTTGDRIVDVDQLGVEIETGNPNSSDTSINNFWEW